MLGKDCLYLPAYKRKFLAFYSLLFVFFCMQQYSKRKIEFLDEVIKHMQRVHIFLFV